MQCQYLYLKWIEVICKMHSLTRSSRLVSCCTSPFKQIFTTSTIGSLCHGHSEEQDDVASKPSDWARDSDLTEEADDDMNIEGTLNDALCYTSRVSELEALIDAGLKDKSGDALVSCAQDDWIEAVQLLLRRMPYDTGTLTRVMTRVVMTTISTGPMRLLVEAGAVVTLNTLCASMRDDLPEITRFVLMLGGHNALHEMDGTPLRIAAFKGYHEVVGVLLQAGADVHAAKDDALRQASYSGFSQVVRVLLAAGADATQVDLYNVDAESIMDMLVSSGATDNHSYALRSSAHRGTTPILRLLGTRLQYTKEQKETALTVAVSEKRLEAVLFLLWVFPDIDVLKALYVSIDQDNPVTARLLVPRLPEEMHGHVVDRTVALGKRNTMNYWMLHGLPFPSMEALKMAVDLGHTEMLHDVLACMDCTAIKDMLEYSHILIDSPRCIKPHFCALRLHDSRACP